jgi:ribosomal protein S18 acetylase RimI-like enzyme
LLLPALARALRARQVAGMTLPVDAPPVTLRPATAADIPYLLELRRQTMTAHQLASGAEASEQERHERVHFRFDCAQLIELDAQPVGTFKVVRDGLDWHLVQIQLAPSLQGQGIGAALIRQLIAEARVAGASLRLNVLHANPARRLYERLGFRITSQGEHDYVMHLEA